MDSNGFGSSRFNRHLRSPSSDRFLGPYSSAPRENPYPSSALSTKDDELDEDDIFTTDFSQMPIASPSSSSSPSSSLGHRHLNGLGGFRSKSSFKSAEASGILAALPEPSGNNHYHQQFFNHKAAALSPPVSSVASSSSSSSAASTSSSAARMIPSIPKPPQERIPSLSIAGGKYHQSAPMNVPMLSQRIRQRHREFYDVDLDEEEEEGEMLPPHELVARSLAQSPMLSCSVLEGAGRTLKGRDLRQVRNAVFRQTGFID